MLKKGSKLKISVRLTSAATRKYRMVWKLAGIAGLKARWATTAEDIATKKVITNTTIFCIQFLDTLNNTKSSLNWIDTFWFNKTTEEFETHFQKLELDVDHSPNRTHAKFWFGNYTLSEGESVYLDPTIETFNSEAGRDGQIQKGGSSYPPQFAIDVHTDLPFIEVGQAYLPGLDWYYLYRGYVSFNTSSIPSLSYNLSVNLKLKTMNDGSDTDFMMKVMGGGQPLYGENGINVSDWGVEPMK